MYSGSDLLKTNSDWHVLLYCVIVKYLYLVLDVFVLVLNEVILVLNTFGLFMLLVKLCSPIIKEFFGETAQFTLNFPETLVVIINNIQHAINNINYEMK